MTKLVELLSKLTAALPALERGWTAELERSGMHVRLFDLYHHVCAASAIPHDLLLHEAYVSAIAFAQLLHRAPEEGLAETTAVARIWRALMDLLDELEPHVSRADAGLRGALLDGEAIQAVVARIAKDGR